MWWAIGILLTLGAICYKVAKASGNIDRFLAGFNAKTTDSDRKDDAA